VVLAQERQEWPQGALLENVISTNRAITSDISQRPNSLFADIENRGREQPDELRDGIGVDDHLGVVSGSGGDVRQSPRGFELKITNKCLVRDDE
jgi:hypothetical protein